MTDFANTSKLDAVNLMLGAIGEAPVNSLQTNGIGDVATATSILDFNIRQVQAVGWHWNTEENFTLNPSTDGRVPLPDNTLKVDVEAGGADLVRRGSYLYDRVGHSYVIGEPVDVTIIFLLPWEELPESARAYITIRSIRQMQARVMGADVGQAYTKEDELMAFIDLRADDTELADWNILDSVQARGIVGNG